MIVEVFKLSLLEIHKSNCSEGNQLDRTAYQWHFGNYTTGPRIGPDGSSGYLIAIRLNPSQSLGKAELYSPQIKGAASGQNLYSLLCIFQIRYLRFSKPIFVFNRLLSILQI
jgi:hypothetical protein